MKFVIPWPWIGAALIAVVVGAGIYRLPLADWVLDFSAWMHGHGAVGVIVFALAYVVSGLIFLPTAPFSIAAGVAYGWWGVPLALTAATTSATLAFLLSRNFAYRTIRKLIVKRPKLQAAAEAVDAEGWKILALLRLSPVLPFGLENYLFGITHMRLVPYVVTTAIGLIPVTVLNVYLGVVGHEASHGKAGLMRWLFLLAGLAATLVVIVVATLKARAMLKQKGVAPAA